MPFLFLLLLLLEVDLSPPRELSANMMLVLKFVFDKFCKSLLWREETGIGTEAICGGMNYFWLEFKLT